MVQYDSARIYLDTAQTNADKVTKINAIIVALEDTALRAAAGEDISEYWLDDGQTKIRTTYRSVDSIMRAINSFEQLKQMYLNRLNGRMVRLVDSKNFLGGRYGNCR